MRTDMKLLSTVATIAVATLSLTSIEASAALNAGEKSQVRQISNAQITARKAELRGQRGPRGQVGPRGPAGPAGVTGAQGPAGPAGAPAFVHFANIGADGTVEESLSQGVLQEHVWHFGGGQYCIIAGSASGVQVTVDAYAVPPPGEEFALAPGGITAQVLIRDGRGGCSFIVYVYDRDGAPVDAGFYILFYSRTE